MLKKIVLGSVMALGVAVPFLATPAADAGERGRVQVAHHCRYEVLYRTCDRDPWRVQGIFENSHRAHESAEYLRCHGYQTRILEM